MHTLDIQIPEADFKLFSKVGRLNFIYPSETPLAKAVTISSIIKTICYDDEVFEEIINNKADPKLLVPKNVKLYEVKYIRECALRDVINDEWLINYGPPNAKIYSRASKISPDAYVKVIALRAINYNLKTLKTRYGSTKTK